MTNEVTRKYKVKQAAVFSEEICRAKLLPPLTVNSCARVAHFQLATSSLKSACRRMFGIICNPAICLGLNLLRSSRPRSLASTSRIP